MEIVLNKILSEIQHQEDKLSSQMMQTADEAYQMTLFLKEMLFTIKMKVLQTGFKDERQEINFFKNIKPQILGKLIYLYFVKFSSLIFLGTKRTPDAEFT